MGKDLGQDVGAALPLIGGAAGFAVGGPAGASLGLGLGGAAEGLIGGLGASNQAQAYEQQQQEALDRDRAAREQLVAQENQLYGPMRQQLVQEAANPAPLNYGPAAGQINAQTLAAQNRLGATLAKRGMTGSGAQAAGLGGLETGRVGELSNAFQTGLNARRALGMHLLQGFNPTQLAQFGEGGLPEQMRFGGAQQGIYNRGAEQGFGGLGKGIAAGLNALNPNGPPQPQAPYVPGGTGMSPLNANEAQMASYGAGAQPQPPMQNNPGLSADFSMFQSNPEGAPQPTQGANWQSAPMLQPQSPAPFSLPPINPSASQFNPDLNFNTTMSNFGLGLPNPGGGYIPEGGF